MIHSRKTIIPTMADYGQGSTYKRQDGRWCASIVLRTGKRRYFYGTSKSEANHKKRDALRAQEGGLAVASGTQTVGQYLGVWLEDVARPTVKPTTFEGYESYIRIHLVPSLGKVRLSELTPQDIQSTMATMRRGGASPRTIQQARAILRRALVQAVRWGLIPTNVATLTEAPRQVRSEHKVLAQEDAARFLAATHQDQLGPLYAVALTLGLRQGELLGLRWEDVDLARGQLTVNQTLHRVAGELVVGEPKTHKSRRTLPLPPSVIALFLEEERRQAAREVVAGKRWKNEHDLVFTSRYGTPFDGVDVTHRFQETLAKHGFPKMRFHDLRHSCVSILLAQGVHPRIVADIAGHSTVNLTLNVYAHALPGMTDDALSRLDRVLSGTPAAPALQESQAGSRQVHGKQPR